MKHQSKWISEADALQWLGITRQALIHHRDKLGINYSYLTGNRVVMYDVEDIEKVLEKNSTKTLKQQLHAN
jgi:hypothetical protein